nr:MAG TPA: hypothetical protein [Caudoviricetes sp.]
MQFFCAYFLLLCHLVTCHGNIIVKNINKKH